MDSTTTTAASAATFPLEDKVAIVTGASRGIGPAVALHLATLGARLLINYTSTSSQILSDHLVSQINALPLPLSSASSPRAVAVQADVSDPAQVTRLFDAAEEAFSAPPHIVVTSAGVLDPTYPAIPDMDLAEFDRIFAVNTRGTFLCIQEGARRIKRGGGGRIVTLSTSLAASFSPGHGAYTASKAAVEAMTKILAKELKGTRITANCVAPGPIATDMFYSGKSPEKIQALVDVCPHGRLGEVEDVAPLIGFLVSDAGEWVNGQIIRVNGGYV